MGAGEKISKILNALERGVIRHSEVSIHVEMALAESGSADDVKALPSWILEDLVKWAHEFEESKSWSVVSSGGIRDVSAEGLKLLALLRNAGIV